MKNFKIILTIMALTCLSTILATSERLESEAFYKFKHKHQKTNQVSNEELQQMLPKSKDQEDDPVLKGQEIFAEGWVKFFHFKSNSAKKPTNFFINPQYDDLKSANKTGNPADPLGSMNANSLLNSDKNKRDRRRKNSQKGATFSSANTEDENGIADPTSFYAVVYVDSVNFLTEKSNGITQVYDALMIDYIRPIPEGNNYNGGVQEVGNFNEGFCFKVATVVPFNGHFRMTSNEAAPKSGVDETWFICTATDALKKTIMDAIIQIKLKKQKEIGFIMQDDTFDADADQLKQTKKNEYINRLNVDNDLKDMNKLDGSSASIKGSTLDGYWKILKDFGDCSLACGGGVQTMQRMCVPPKTGGKACVGPAIVTKPCNTQPCPTVETLKDAKKKQREIIEKPVVKMMQLSSRPQRYDKCYLKEGDAFMIKNDKETVDFGTLPRIPIRLVLNNKSLTAYQDESLKTNLATFILDDSTFSVMKDDPSCFIITGGKEKKAFCRLDSSNANNWVDEWYYDFNLFKNQCKQERATLELDPEDENKLQDEFKNKMIQVKNELLSKRQKKLNERMNDNDRTVANKDLQKTQEMTLMAIQKELKLEQLLEKEEAERENEEVNTLETEIEEEKKKKECLLQSIKEKQLEDQFNVQKGEIQDNIEQMKKEAKKEIEVKRSQMKKKIENMRKRNKRRLDNMKQQMLSIRMEVANTLGQSSKDGDMMRCFKGTEDKEIKEKMKNYCTPEFIDDIAKFSMCMTPEQFCYVCCENEFGELHVDKRSECERKRCEDAPVQSDGTWIYVNKLE